MIKRESAGFTMLELMVVVVIIGILSAVAIPSYRKFIAQAKSSEAVTNLNAIARGAVRYYHEEHTDAASGKLKPPSFPDSKTSCNPIPAKPPCGAYRANIKAWYNEKCWRELSFAINKAHYYQYQYSSNNKTGSLARFWAKAYGDLDCDGTQSTFTIKGDVDPNTLEVKVSRVFTKDEDE